MMPQFPALEAPRHQRALESKVILGEAIKASANEVVWNKPSLAFQLQTAPPRLFGFLPSIFYLLCDLNSMIHVRCHHRQTAFTPLLDAHRPLTGSESRRLPGSDHFTIQAGQNLPPRNGVEVRRPRRGIQPPFKSIKLTPNSRHLSK